MTKAVSRDLRHVAMELMLKAVSRDLSRQMELTLKAVSRGLSHVVSRN